MNAVKKTSLIFLVLFVFLIASSIYQYIVRSDGKLHLIFCNVGQGDGIFITTPKGSHILVDGGPDQRILDCLSEHMLFWDKTIHLVILTHPHADHLNGLIPVAKQYHIEHFATEELSNSTKDFQELIDTLRQNHVPIHYVSAGNRFTIGSIQLNIAGPSKDFLLRTSPQGKIGESKEFGSLETLLSYDNFHALLTGDSQADELHEGVGAISIPQLVVLQVPHHGSVTGLDTDLLTTFHPELAVISVGLHNRYNHPSPFTLSMIDQLKILLKRTDRDGDVEIVSDGKSYSIK